MRRLRYEELEPRILYSVDPVWGWATPLLVLVDKRLLQDSGELVPAGPSVQQQVVQQGTHHELVVIDTGVADWDLLLQDIRKNESASTRFHVVLLDAEKDGIA